MEENINIIFGKRLQKLRVEKGLSQEKFAEIVGVHRTYIGMIERAEKNITLSNLDKIAKALKISLSELLSI